MPVFESNMQLAASQAAGNEGLTGTLRDMPNALVFGMHEGYWMYAMTSNVLEGIGLRPAPGQAAGVAEETAAWSSCRTADWNSSWSSSGFPGAPSSALRRAALSKNQRAASVSRAGRPLR